MNILGLLFGMSSVHYISSGLKKLKKVRNQEELNRFLEWEKRRNAIYINRYMDIKSNIQDPISVEKEFVCDQMILSDQQIKDRINPDSLNSPYYKFVGNRSVVRKISRISYTILKDPSKSGNVRLSFLGPPSTGKTMLARLFAECSNLPFIEFSPKMLYSVNAIRDNIVDLIGDNFILPNQKIAKVPPLVLFIDEIHDVKNSVIQGLLKATESKDHMLHFENCNISFDTKNIAWIIATTDRGKLFDAFDTRFRKVQFNLYTSEEISRIIAKEFPDWNCKAFYNRIAYYERTPREAISLAQEVDDLMEIKDLLWENEHWIYDGVKVLNNSDDSWCLPVDEVAQDNGFHSCGLTNIQYNILCAVKEHPISLEGLTTVAQCKKEELQKFILPRLISYIEDSPALMYISKQGFTITDYGIKFLEKHSN